MKTIILFLVVAFGLGAGGCDNRNNKEVRRKQAASVVAAYHSSDRNPLANCDFIKKKLEECGDKISAKRREDLLMTVDRFHRYIESGTATEENKRLIEEACNDIVKIIQQHPNCEWGVDTATDSPN